MNILGFCNGNLYKSLFFFNNGWVFFLNKNPNPWLVFLIIISRLPCLEEKRTWGRICLNLRALGLWVIFHIFEWLPLLECPVSLKLSSFTIKAGDRGGCQKKLMFLNQKMGHTVMKGWMITEPTVKHPANFRELCSSQGGRVKDSLQFL